MESFKRILRDAIQADCEWLELEDGQPPYIEDGGERQVMPGHESLTQDFFPPILGFLFPDKEGALHGGDPVQGTLKIPQIGDIRVIAVKRQNYRLMFFFGDSNAFDDVWERENNPVAASEQQPPAEHSDSIEGDVPLAIKVRDISADEAEDSPGEDQLGTFTAGSLDSEDDQQQPTSSEDDDASLPPLALQYGTAESPSADDDGLKIAMPGLEDPDSDEHAEHHGLGPSALDNGAFSHSYESDDASGAGEDFVPGQMFQAPGPADNDAEEATRIVDKADFPSNIPLSPPVAQDQGLHRPSEAAPPLAVAATSATPVEPEASLDVEYGDMGIGEAKPSKSGDHPIDPLLKKMIELGASDCHLTIGEPLIFRIDGEVRRQGENPLRSDDMQSFIDPILPLPNRKQFIDNCDTDFAYEIEGTGRFRVNVFRNRMGVGAVLRHIPSEILTAKQLGLPKSIMQFCSLHKGLVVVTGPTGSGKSTTLAAMVDSINKSRKEHILTIEDPVEFVHPSRECLVNQREVHRHTMSFSSALRAALREDPDIILIGEMRDLETIAIAIETAETGHLVFGTLHTNTAVSTVDRIIDQFPPKQQAQVRAMLSSSLKGVVAQTLVRKKGGGRAAAHEILVMNDAVASMVREGKSHMIQNHMVTQKQEGNIMLNESLLKLVAKDLVDLKEAFSKAIDKKSFIEMAKRMSLPVKDLGIESKAS